jgi:hypothetical protein
MPAHGEPVVIRLRELSGQCAPISVEREALNGWQPVQYPSVAVQTAQDAANCPARPIICGARTAKANRNVEDREHSCVTARVALLGIATLAVTCMAPSSCSPSAFDPSRYEAAGSATSIHRTSTARYPASKSVVAAARYLSTRAGVKAFAVIDNKGKIAGVAVHMRFHSASVVKSMLLVAYLQAIANEDHGLDSFATGLLYPMIHSSDNEAASAVFAIVGESGLARIAREAHMADYESGDDVWGFTEISAADMARFFLIQDSLIPRQFVGYARWLLSNIEPSESWGVPAVARPRFQVFFKGGWLPEIEGLVNQAARLERRHETFAMAVLTRDDPSMDYGEDTIEGVTARLLGEGLSPS